MKFVMPNTTVKSSLKFSHPVDTYHLDDYVRQALGIHAAIVSIDVKYAVLNQEQSDALYDLCRRDLYGDDDPAKDIQHLRLESKKRMQLALKGILE